MEQKCRSIVSDGVMPNEKNSTYIYKYYPWNCYLHILALSYFYSFSGQKKSVTGYVCQVTLLPNSLA